MSRPLVFCFLAAVALAAGASAQKAPSKSAFDKSALETYVRHLWVVGPEYNVSISDPKPAADLPGFKEVTVRVSQGLTGRDLLLLVSNDGKKIVQGNVYDINSNPFKKQLDGLKTQFQPSFGTPGAPVVLVAFSDMQCPYCKVEAQMIRQKLVQAYPTQVRFYFKDFPLESLHPWAKPAAIAGHCVFREDPAAFWNYHDWIFGAQETITPANLRDKVMEWAKGQNGIDALQLGRCMDEKATEKEIDANLAEGRALGVDGTPTLFVNGRRLPAGTDWENLKRVIDSEIKYQATAKNAGEDCGCEAKIDAPGLPPQAQPIAPLEKRK